MTRRYEDACGVSRALNVVGDRWSLLVVRELLFGPKRFTDLRNALPGVSPNVLTQRLSELADRGILEKRRGVSGTELYHLTAVGRALEDVLLALGAWGSRVAPPRPGSRLSVESLLLAMKTTRRPGTDVTEGEYELDIDGDVITASVSGPELLFRRGPSTRPRARITATGPVLREVIFSDRDVTDAVATGALSVEGDAGAAAAFLEQFERPALFAR